MFWPGQNFDISYTLLSENSGHTHLDLFFIGPFYHQLLPHLDQVIVVDLDLEFRLVTDKESVYCFGTPCTQGVPK